MRASQVLQKCLPNSLSAMHVLRMRALLSAVQALIVGRRLTLTDIARTWPGAERVRAPLKAFDRLLGNRHLHGERGAIEADMARWLLRGPQPVILIDWSDLKPDKSWCLLRAAVPVGGRTLTLLDTIVRGKEQGSAEAERHFLQQLRKLIPEGVTPILVTDAGFRTPWFRAVSALGWHWVGRLRGATRIKLQEAPNYPEHWHDSRTLHAKAGTAPGELPPALVNRSSLLACRLVVCSKTRKGRKKSTRRTPQQASRSAVSLKAAAREREPWLIVAAPELSQASARQLVNLYARRMQIELAFRDLKSHRYGHALEDSLTRQGPRLQILLLISTLATFVSWLAGLVCEAADIAHWLWPSKSTRKRYSTPRVGREALVRGWPLGPPARWLDLLRSPPGKALDQMTLLP
ncbi:IS4 family transposase [Stenotrophomonas maltophilia]|uniref:IS4 family transposase n=1 Tax=Stenotrophomonas maltophilia TaxID=40324 RepID=UPI0012AFE8CD|nr:IS4 family transposase [Stenotrophomonas maltophilia]QGM01114.1 IS4 family transposase [Stenotrophomonas maltophilia]